MKIVEGNKARSLDYAELWFRDGLAVCRPPAFHESLEVDMSRTRQLIEIARQRNIRITYTQALVRATALVLAENPDLHTVVCGRKLYSPLQVDIAISVNAETSIAPVIIIEGANAKTVDSIAAEMVRRLPEVQEAHGKMLLLLRRWGWLVPFAFLRRRLLLLLYHSFEFRRKGSGTFQVSTTSGVDSFATPLFNSCGILTAGRVKDRPQVIGGKITVVPTVYLTCSADHRIWNGHACQRFLLAMQELLESDRLHRELGIADAFEQPR